MESSKYDEVTPGADSEICKGKKVIHLYSLEEATKALQGLTLITDDEISENKEEVQLSVVKPDVKPELLSVLPSVSKMFCLTCAVSFNNRNELVEHFKCDWHRYNVHLKVRGLNSVTEEAFADMTGDISSISGSDSESDGNSDTRRDDSMMPVLPENCDANEDKYPSYRSRRQKLFFRNGNGEIVSIHKCLIFGKKRQLNDLEMTNAVGSLPSSCKWAIFLAGGGHFAGAVFDGDKVIQHKTFHRYVVRAKRGSAQSQRDKQGNAPKSAGATLRRHNEAALTQEIQELLVSWSAELKACNKIFLRAPGFNNAIFFGGKTPPLNKSDSRVFAISIQTRRPTYHELLRVHKVLNTVEVYDPECFLSECIAPKQSSVLSSNGSDVSGSKMENVQITENESELCLKNEETNRHLEPMPDSASRAEIADESDDNSSDAEIDHPTSERIMTDETLPEESENSKRPRKKKKNASNTKSENVEEPVLLNNDLMELRNQLFTASKTGNVVALELALDNLRTYLREQHTDSAERTDNVKQSRNDTDTTEQSTESTHSVEQPVKISQIATVNGNGSSDTLSSCQLPDDMQSGDDIPVLDQRLSEFLSQQFGPQLTTLLHVAARAGHKPVMRILLELGADPAVRDSQNQLPYLVASSKDAKNEFRRFMAQNPTKFDYLKAQIPGPLTDEMENERKNKAAEKKKIQKKNKKDKLKEEQLEEQKQKEEEQKRQEFLAMGDREKRAYAAEQRFKLQLEREKLNQNAVVNRCWQCGSDLSGKVPFEYYDYKFCSSSHLKEYRLKHSEKS